MLWFVRSRSYVSVPDIRRRFNVGMDGNEDVTPIRGSVGRVFVGLPAQPARLLQELWQEGKVGLELAADVKAPTVTGVYGIYQRGESPPPRSAGGSHLAADGEPEEDEVPTA